MSTSVAGQAHRSPWSKKILATEWGLGQIQVCRRGTLAGIPLRRAGRVHRHRVPFKYLWGLRMVNAKMSQSGKCLPLSLAITPERDRQESLKRQTYPRFSTYARLWAHPLRLRASSGAPHIRYTEA